MTEPQFNSEGIEIPSEILEFGDYAILRYHDGREYKLYGWGSGKGKLDLDPRIDLTKPIYEQAMRLWKQDEASELRQADSKAA